MALRLAVVGGGMSGLAAAHRALELATAGGERADITLFEAAGRLGGSIATVERDGYLVEWGADMFVTDKPAAVGLCERLGIAGRLQGANAAYRRSLILRAGRPVPVPEGFVLMAPASMLSVLASPILGLRGKLRAACEPLVPRRAQTGDESLASFVERRLGREALDRLVEPLVAGIYTGIPERLSLAATLPRFLEMERQHGSLWRAARRARSGKQASGARYELFVSLPRGMRELVEALEARLAGGGVRLELAAEVTGLAEQRGGYELGWQRRTATSREHFDAVVMALPAPRAVPLLRGVAPGVARELAAIRHASSAIVVSGYRLSQVRHPLDAFGLVVPAVERRQVFAVSFASRKFSGRAPEGSIELRSFVGGIRQPHLCERSDEALCALVRRELGEMLGVRGRPEMELVARHDRAMPQYDLGHLERVAVIERELDRYPSLALAGNALRGVGVPDCVDSGERAAERLLRARSATGPHPDAATTDEMAR